MVKMGTFRGIPVYVLQYSHEYQTIESSEEKMYVCEGKLFYHGTMIGTVEGKQLTSFYEERFNEARRKDWTAETCPQEEEKPEYEAPETGCGNSLVDDFMASWRENIDSEINKLQVTMKNMEAEIRANHSNK